MKPDYCDVQKDVMDEALQRYEQKIHQQNLDRISERIAFQKDLEKAD